MTDNTKETLMPTGSPRHVMNTASARAAGDDPRSAENDIRQEPTGSETKETVTLTLTFDREWLENEARHFAMLRQEPSLLVSTEVIRKALDQETKEPQQTTELARWLIARESSAMVQKATASKDGMLRWICEGRKGAYREVRERLESAGEDIR